MAAESIGALYSTKIPGYADNADIQAAFKLYHYGSTDYNTANANTANLVNPSIAYTLNDLQGQITNLDPTGSVSKSTIDAKGDLLVGSANDTVDNLSIGSDNYVLTADSTQTLGLKWAALPTASTSGAGVVQLTDSTSSTSTSTAATPASVKSAYDLASAAAEAGIPVTLMMMGG
jgi:Phage tail fibre repeat